MPEKELQSEQVRSGYLALFDTVQKTPQVIDDLWLVSEVEINPYGLRAAKRLGGLLEQDGHREEDWELWLNYNASRALNYLVNPGYWQDENKVLKSRIPQGSWQFSYEIPTDFDGQKGFLGRSRDSILGVKRLRVKGKELPEILIVAPKAISIDFPWQAAHVANMFLRQEGQRRLVSKYVEIDGVSAYELVHTPSDNVDTNKLKFGPFIYSMATLLRGGKSYKFGMRSEKNDPQIETFEKFLASIKS